MEKLLKIVTVIGDAEGCSEEELDFAENLGYKLASLGYVIVTGGRGGIMEAVSGGLKRRTV